ncbi:MAG TPA: hypothetical protein VN709_10835 [Terriglobales bacterium]|nr:hypothetical protein [Terriglobales bacterium]
MKKAARKPQRFAVGAKVWVRMPGVSGEVVACDDKPSTLGEYIHTVKTAAGERRELGCTLELLPEPIGTPSKSTNTIVGSTLLGE